MKNILVVLDKIPKFNIEVSPTIKISDIKLILENYFDQNQLLVDNYIFDFYLNSQNKMSVFFTKKYDQLTLEKVFNSMENSKINIIKKEGKNFTGIKDVDLIFLSNLNDQDLGNFCKVSQYTRDLCKNDIFWLNRTLKRFSPVFGAIEKVKEYKEKSNSKTWREYYIDLVNSMEKMITRRYGIVKKENREDFQILHDYIFNNTKKYLDSDVPNSPNFLWINEDFIDLNLVFDKILSKEMNPKQKLDLLLNLFNISRFNIDKTNISNFLHEFHNSQETAFKILLTYKNNVEIREEILKYMVEWVSRYIDIFNILVSPYIENSDEILKSLFETIREGSGLEKKKIDFFLKTAIKKGAKTDDIKKYYNSNIGFGRELDIPEEESYDDNMKVVKNFLKKMKK